VPVLSAVPVPVLPLLLRVLLLLLFPIVAEAVPLAEAATADGAEPPLPPPPLASSTRESTTVGDVSFAMYLCSFFVLFSRFNWGCLW
jgi:hypothetical protein